MSILTHEKLLELAGLPANARISTLRKRLKKAGIPYREISGRIFSTDDAITALLVGKSKNAKRPEPNWAALDE